MRRIITSLAVLLGIGVLAAPAAAQTTPPTTTPPTTAAPVTTIPGGMPVSGTLTITPATQQVVAGSKVSVTGTAVTPGTATLHLLSASNTTGIALGTATVSAAGMLSAEITIPAEATAGVWFVRAIDGGAKVFAGELTIGSADAGVTTTVAPTPDALPNNGPLASLPVIIGAAIIGFVAMVFAPRKRKA
jgi:hypothetical protein